MFNLLFLFAVYSVLGWVTETVYFYIKSKKYTKRGFLGGPYCPLYGFSIAACTYLTEGLKNNIFLIFTVGVTVCTVFELLTGIIIEKVTGKKMWDYSNVNYNFKGHICIKFSLIWGLLTVVCIKIINPILINNNDVNSLFIKAVFSVTIILMMIANIIFLKRKTNH